MRRIGSNALCALMIVFIFFAQEVLAGPVQSTKPPATGLSGGPVPAHVDDFPVSAAPAEEAAQKAPVLPVKRVETGLDPITISEPETGHSFKPALPAARAGDYPDHVQAPTPLQGVKIPIEDNTGCANGFSNNCPPGTACTFPQAPPGFSWNRLEDKYTFSAYALPGEEVYMGDLVDIPGILGLKAKEEFLFSVFGLGMQGGGTIRRLDDDRVMQSIYIKYISGHWEVDGQDVYIDDQWHFVDTGEVLPPELTPFIRLEEARFSILPEPELIPYYSIAASNRFPLGTKIYVPELQQFGGIFEVQDRGGAFDADSLRFDVFTGKDMNEALEWIRLGPARHNLSVYMLAPLP